MKKTEFMRAMGEIDQAYIADADPDAVELKSSEKKGFMLRRRKLQFAAMLAGAAVIVLTVGLVSGIDKRSEKVPADLENTEREALASEEISASVKQSEEVVTTVPEEPISELADELPEQLTWLSEKELFSLPELVLRAQIIAKERLTQKYTCLTLQPVRVIRGAALPLDEPVRLLIRHSPSSRGPLTSGAAEGTEGIFCLFPVQGSFAAENADYTAADPFRYAILAFGERLLFEKTAYYSFDRSWNLDRAEKHIEEILEEKELPCDFSFAFTYAVQEASEADDLYRSYDSETGSCKLGGRASWKKTEKTFDVKLNEQTLQQIYDVLCKLDQFPACVEARPGSGRENACAELRWTENGKFHCANYNGWALTSPGIDDPYANLMRGVLTDIDNYMESDPAYAEAKCHVLSP